MVEIGKGEGGRRALAVTPNDIEGKQEQVIFRELAPEIPSTTYATFALYKYPAKFIPQVVAYALKTYARPGMSVFDPFAGYGTVGTVARLYGNDYELWDLNPLLAHLHPISVMEPLDLETGGVIRAMASYQGAFAPDWPNIGHWYPEQFLPMLSSAWGFYHSLDNERVKRILLVPLIRTTRYFSYNDERRQKLSRSRVAEKRVNMLLTQDWESRFFKKIQDGMGTTLKKLQEYQCLGPKPVGSTVKAGVDSLSRDLETEHDILMTSPPYLQAQEYIRAAKMDLFWLGYSKASIKELIKKEMPYYDVPSIPVHSPTYLEYLRAIKEAHLRRIYQQYFFGVLGALTRLQEKVRRYLLLFVGSATIRTRPIPLDRIFCEHFCALGWRHEITLVDTIVARAMFFYKANPATGSRDKRMSTEQLVVLSRR